MPPFFSNQDTALFFRLLLSHLLTDFVLQPTVWVTHKRKNRHRSKYLYWHSLVAGLLAFVLAGNPFWGHWSGAGILIFVGLSHGLIDYLKVSYDHHIQSHTTQHGLPVPALLPSFLIDQVGHISILLIAWLWLTNAWNSTAILLELAFGDIHVVAIICGYLLCTTPTGFIIGMATRKWQDQLTDPDSPSDTLNDAGKWIGVAERVIIFSFVLLNQYEAIGFLIAAKSLLRFREGTKAAKQSEYVLVGTLLSYGFAILTCLLIKLAIA